MQKSSHWTLGFVTMLIPICWLILACSTLSGQEPTPTPAAIREDVVVNAERTEVRVGETPASISLISRDTLNTSAAPTLDETLRQIIGFSTFRRSGSRSANPTTQGVSLRGVGSSGASRAIVFFNGVQLNDPFGGWIQWQRISPVAVERVEVLRGGASSLYGNYALSGAILIIPRKLEKKYTFSSEVFAGSQRTISGSAFGGVQFNGFSFDLTAAAFQTGGFIPVERASRGPIDSRSGVRSTNLSTRIEYRSGKAISIFIQPAIFGEVRTNGTGLQTNRTHIRQLIVGGKVATSQYLTIDWRLFGGSQVYDQIFSAVNASRNIDTLTRLQRVPAGNFGGSAIFSRDIGVHSLVAGIEARAIHGASDEIVYANGSAASVVGAGGRENSAGGFLRDLVKIGDKIVIVGAIRFDSWFNKAGLSVTRVLSTTQTMSNRFADRHETALSPRVAVLYQTSDRISLYANASSSFRAPTLNELYRGFRVGNVSTLANADLRAERATNAEAGISYKLSSFSVRSSAFWTGVERPVSNVTLSSTSSLITRQRQNVGKTRVIGFEIEGETTINRLNVSAGYLFADSRFVEFLADSPLVGLRVPQVARHQLTLQALYSIKKWTVALQGRAAGKQFDDDQNNLRLEPFVQLDVLASRKIGPSISIFGSVENLTNSRYSTGRTPIRTVSSPINFRAGIRWK